MRLKYLRAAQHSLDHVLLFSRDLERRSLDVLLCLHLDVLALLLQLFREHLRFGLNLLLLVENVNEKATVEAGQTVEKIVRNILRVQIPRRRAEQ